MFVTKGESESNPLLSLIRVRLTPKPRLDGSHLIILHNCKEKCDNLLLEIAFLFPNTINLTIWSGYISLKQTLIVLRERILPVYMQGKIKAHACLGHGLSCMIKNTINIEICNI